MLMHEGSPLPLPPPPSQKPPVQNNMQALSNFPVQMKGAYLTKKGEIGLSSSWELEYENKHS